MCVTCSVVQVVRVEKSIIAATAFQSKFGASITEAAERQQKGLAGVSRGA